MITLSFRRLNSVVALGAHCDDIAIGAGATLSRVCEENPGLAVTALVMSGGGTDRATEERAALLDFCPGAKLSLSVLDIPDGRFPAHWDEVKSAIEHVRAEVDPDLILAPNAGDAHQDHRLVAEVVPTVFRDHLTLGYEIVKWDGDLGRPNAYLPLEESVAEHKCALLAAHYPSQHRRSWYDREMFLGLARIRGIECGARYAEAFQVNKFVLDPFGV
jgi:LmbE family N-acetylglucosaminyl deacetylase